jgi:hypothetical protein
MTTPDTKPESRKRLGKILSVAGAIWIVLYAVSNFVNAGGTPLGNVLGFFGENLFFPVALLFSGRAIRRQADRGGGVSQSKTQRTPPILTLDQPPSPPQRPAPRPAPRPKPKVAPPPPPIAATPDIEELAEAIGFDDLDSKAGAPDPTSSHTPKSSEEMIAEARKKLNRNPRSGE